MDYLEQEAIESVNTLTKLRKRFNYTLSVMFPEYRIKFKNSVLDFDNKKLITKDNKSYLLWSTRSMPNREVSYENQQTSMGCVTYYEISV